MRKLIAVMAWLACSAASGQQRKADELADLSLEELANIEVTSVSRRAERLVDAPASVYVISAEDIRRSGVTSLPEALRLAPNLQVARVDARQYAITARGFNNTIANKLLVLIDGRAVYTPLFSGVFWDEQDVFLADVERIEVISGPGGTLWGSNAVNGVINVITRRASDARGAIAFAGGGNLEMGVGARYGTSVAGGGALRIYAKAFDRDHTVRADDSAASDGWRNSQAGFRADWGEGSGAFTLQGDAYQGRMDQPIVDDVRTSGGNLLARWSRQSASGSRLQVQSYFDYRDREIPGSITERLSTLDVELQHSLQPRPGNVLTWGVGHRRAHDDVSNAPAIGFLPEKTELRWTNAFAQDELALRDDLRLTLGAKIERNPYTGNEWLPSARLAWKPGAERTVWASASRAVRAPARLDRELFIPGQPPFQLAGGPDFRSEISKVVELGYRAQSSGRTGYSLTVFHARHDHLRSLEPIGGGVFSIGNEMEGDTSGLEAWASWHAAATLRLRAGALFLDQDLRLKPGSGDPNGPRAAGNDPKHQFTLGASVDLPRGQDLDILLRYVGRLPDPEVPGYAALDLRYALAVRRALQLSVVLQNVLDRQHPEFGAPATRSEIERGVFARLQWQP